MSLLARTKAQDLVVWLYSSWKALFWAPCWLTTVKSFEVLVALRYAHAETEKA